MNNSALEAASSLKQLRQFMALLTRALDALVEGVAASARDEVAEYLSLYGEIVPVIDERLAHCAELLRRGLRDEALGYEADEPSLIEAATLLDLAGRPRYKSWKSRLVAERFPVPTGPRMDYAAALAEAQAATATLKLLFDRWRRMNLANAPLAQRIRVLRKFREQDPDNVLWAEALAEHERQRLMQFDRDIRQAVQARDERALAQICGELTEPWEVPVPQRLADAARAALESFKGTRMDCQLDDVLQGLVAAHEARDLEAGRELAGRWQALLEEKGTFVPDDPRLARAQPALGWVASHLRLAALASEVWQALDARPVGLRARQEWVRSLVRMGDELEDLAARLRGEIDLEPLKRSRQRIVRERDMLRGVERFRQRIALVSAAGAVLVITSGVLAYVRERGRTRDVAAAVARLDGELAALKAGTLIDLPDHAGWPKAITSDPQVDSRLRANRAEAQRQVERRTRLQERLQEIDGAIVALDGVERADPFKTWPEEFARATVALAAIDSRNDAVTDDERARVVKARGAIDARKRRLLEQADAECRKRLQALEAGLAAVADAPICDPEAATQALEDWSKSAAALREACGVAAAPQAAADYSGLRVVPATTAEDVAEDGRLNVRARELLARVGVAKSQAAAESELDRALGDWTAYARRLEDMAAEFSAMPIARDYRAAAESAPAWTAAAAWSEFVDAHVRPLDAVTPGEAKALIDALGALPPAVKQAGYARDLVTLLEASLTTFAERNPAAAAEDIVRFTKGPFMGELLWMVKTDRTPESYYYALKRPETDESGGTQRSFKVVTAMRDGAGAWPEKPITQQVVEVKPPAHLGLGEKLREMLEAKARGASGLNFDRLLLDVIKTVIVHEGVDPVVRLVMLRKAVLVAASNSAVVGRTRLPTLVDDMGRIPDVATVELRSFVPVDREENAAYVRVRDLVAPPMLAKCREELAAAELALERDQATLAGLRAAPILPVGRLTRDCRGELGAVFKESAGPGPGPVWCLTADGSAVEAGRVGADGRFAPAQTACPAGSPLFVRVTRPGGGTVKSKPATAASRSRGAETGKGP